MHTQSQAQERAKLAEINQLPLRQRLAYYTKKSGPGWLQAAITLGGSLAGALYLGVFMGNNMMWLQPLAMIMGVIMLSAISYVTLTTGERPFPSIKAHVSPVLAWAWIIATLMANIVWCMPQFALGTAAFQQNLGIGLPTWVICFILLGLAFGVNYFYETGAKGIQLFELILKVLVGIVVISFFGVVIALSMSGSLSWGKILAGFIPNPSLLFKAAPTFAGAIEATGEHAAFWQTKIAADQRDVLIAAFGTAVGINMTFLLPYSMLKKGWEEDHRPLAIFDLSIGLIVPYVLATACVVIAASSQFHTKYRDVLDDYGNVRPEMANGFNQIADVRIQDEVGVGESFAAMSDAQKDAARAALPAADKQLAAMLVKRDNFKLATALEPLTGKGVAQIVFGIGVLGMALSTIIILMLINGFTFCEMFGQPNNRTLHLTGAMVAGLGGFLGPLFFWSNANAKAALAIPTSVIGSSLLPIAYFTFLLLMNSRKVMGDNRPQGKAKIIWNVLMVTATSLAALGSVFVLSNKGGAGQLGIAALAALAVLGVMGFLKHEKEANASAGSGGDASAAE